MIITRLIYLNITAEIITNEISYNILINIPNHYCEVFES